MPPVTVAERRRHPRFEDRLRVLFVADTDPGVFHPGRLTDLSVDGVRLHAACSFLPGSRLYLGIFLYDATDPLVALGAVQHCEREGDEVAHGLQFLNVSVEQRRAIERLASYLRQRHGEEAAGPERATEALVRPTRDETWWQ